MLIADNRYKNLSKKTLTYCHLNTDIQFRMQHHIEETNCLKRTMLLMSPSSIATNEIIYVTATCFWHSMVKPFYSIVLRMNDVETRWAIYMITVVLIAQRYLLNGPNFFKDLLVTGLNNSSKSVVWTDDILTPFVELPKDYKRVTCGRQINRLTGIVTERNNS